MRCLVLGFSFHSFTCVLSSPRHKLKWYNCEQVFSIQLGEFSKTIHAQPGGAALHQWRLHFLNDLIFDDLVEHRPPPGTIGMKTATVSCPSMRLLRSWIMRSNPEK